MSSEEKKYGGLDKIKKFKSSLNNFSLGWGFTDDEAFDKIVAAFVLEKGVLNVDVFILRSTLVNIESLEKTIYNKVIPFGSRTYLKRISPPPIKPIFNYKNETALVFLPHNHYMIIERIKPLLHDIKMYLKIEGKWLEFLVKVGEWFEVPAGALHAAIIPEANECQIEWHKYIEE